MQFNHDLDVTKHTIRSYGPGEVLVVLPLVETETGADSQEPPKGLQQETLTESLVISPSTLIRDWRPQTVDALTEADVEQILALKPEVVIFGTGARLIWPERAVMKPLMDAGIGYEIMDTAAACRTYNILSHEGRDVVAGLMMI